MHILLDECVPQPLRRELADHEVRTVVEMGWAGKRNGELIQLLRAETFAAFAPTNRLGDLVPLMPNVRKILEAIQPGTVVEVQAS